MFAVYAEQQVKIVLSDVNDERPTFINTPRPFLATVSSNAPPGTSVYQLLARDEDRDSDIRYNLESGQPPPPCYVSFRPVTYVSFRPDAPASARYVSFHRPAARQYPLCYVSIRTVTSASALIRQH